MHLKRYQAQSVKDAFRAVRDELGPDALIVSTRMVSAPGAAGLAGRRLVEVTAAADRPHVPEGRQPSQRRATEGRGPDPSLAGHGEARSAQARAERLTASGVTASPATEVAAADPTAWRRWASLGGLRTTLADRWAPLAARDETYAPVEVFVGPPGAGKTTTIAKIAAQERARRGNRLGLLAADGFRVGAVEQLRLYASILGSPLTVARTPYELLTAVETAAVPTLVDTAGRSPGDESSSEMLRVVAGRPGVRIHLVVPADMLPAALEKVIARFDRARPSRLVLTRVDEAGSLAPLVGLLRGCGLPVSYLGTGQTVPDDLEVATPRALAGWMAGDLTPAGAAA
jgi:flagellar biosynthesis protein FlhF